MRYLIYDQGSAFYTDWFTIENNYREGMVVIDMTNNTYTHNGRNWLKIAYDHL